MNLSSCSCAVEKNFAENVATESLVRSTARTLTSHTPPRHTAAPMACAEGAALARPTSGEAPHERSASRRVYSRLAETALMASNSCDTDPLSRSDVVLKVIHHHDIRPLETQALAAGLVEST